MCLYWNYSPKLRHGTGLIQKVAEALGDAPIDLGSRLSSTLDGLWAWISPTKNRGLMMFNGI
jgi:hypothetical protein